MSEAKISSKQSEFDEIIKQIGNAGPFQTRFAIVFVSFVAFLGSMQYMTKIISVAVPDHWCYVPGRENTNYTREEWKKITIPMEVNTNGIDSYYKCARFTNELQDDNVIIKCDYGWEYDHTWYDATASMQNDWVCDNYMIPTNVLAINRASEMIGTIVFGQLSDNYGRMPIFYAALITTLVGRIATVFTSSWIYLFYFFSCIGALPGSSLIHSPVIIAMEISGASNRAFIGMLLGYGWAMGITISPLFMWWQRDWMVFCLLTTLPCAIFLFSQKWMIESPRWLASRGKNRRCIRVLNQIAKTNKMQIPGNIEARVIKSNSEENNAKIHTIFSLFSSARLAKNIIVLVYSLSAISLVYLCVILSATSLDGNPYINYLFLGMVDLPIFAFNKYACDRFGRRLLALFSLLTTFIGCLTMAFLVQDTSNTLIMTVVSIITKGAAAMTMSTLHLMVIETCPTCVRQTGASLEAIITNSFCILGPYIVALGFSVNMRLPYIIYATIIFLALVCCFFLPETLGHQLPDSLDDAATFGANQDFWGNTKTKDTAVLNEAAVPLKYIRR